MLTPKQRAKVQVASATQHQQSKKLVKAAAQMGLHNSIAVPTSKYASGTDKESTSPVAVKREKSALAAPAIYAAKPKLYVN